MADSLSGFSNSGKKTSKSAKISRELVDVELNYNGSNEDIVSAYYWHLNFPYLVPGRKYVALKVEDHHYFSESSQYGAQIRQIKGGSIKAFQENLAQLVQLIKIHLIPLLKEVKQADFYKRWFDEIQESDSKIQEMKRKGIKDNDPEMNKYRGIRNEAINHIKDKWVNEVDGGRMWQMNRSSGEQGLDFALLPQLFFGINLDDPLAKNKTLKEQLDEDIYTVDISQLAKEQVARFLYKFYTWLPTALKDTDVTFKLKISALKQFYAQLQMYVNFMKPLLIEIARKTEDVENENRYKGFDMDNPDFVNLFDYSYSFIKQMQIKSFNAYQIADLEFTRHGFPVRKKDTIKFGPHSGKTGFIVKEESSGYKFVQCDAQEIDKMTDKKFKEKLENWKKNPVHLEKIHLTTHSILMMDFSQRRHVEIFKSDQGPQQIPYMRNRIRYRCYVWNLFEIASFRESVKIENLELLETFIEEVNVIKEDLMKYVDYFVDIDEDEESSDISKEEKKDNNSNEVSLILGPLQGLSDIFSTFVPKINSKPKILGSISSESKDEIENHHIINEVMAAEDIWKCYAIYKKILRFMSVG